VQYENLLAGVLDDPSPEVDERIVFALAFVLREVDEIIEITEHLPNAPDEELLRLLRLLPEGTDLPDDETGAKSREAQYELYLGTIFRRGGLKAVHGHPDLTVLHAEREFYIEAKRPGNESRVDDRVRSAVHQLRGALASGMIAISLDQVLRPRQSILEAPALAYIAPEVAKLVARFVQERTHMWNSRLRSEPVDALLITARVPARLLSTGHLVIGTNIHVVPISQTGPEVSAFLEAAVNAYQEVQARGAA